MQRFALKVYVLIIFFITAASLYGQQMDRKTYDTKLDSLKSLKSILSVQNAAAQSAIDSLKKYSAKLDDLTQKCRNSVDVLKYGKELGARVYEGKVWKGMTESMLRDSWGKPDKTHTNKYKWGIFTQYYYGDITYYFKNGRLIDWQQKSK